jgi:hypothetical protein
MQNEYAPQREAEKAMKQAVAAKGLERQRLIRVAQAWHEIARAGSLFGSTESGWALRAGVADRL